MPAGRVMSYNLAPRCAALPWHAGTRARAGRRRGDAYDAEQTYDSSLAPARRGVHFVGNLSRDGLDEAQWVHSLWWGLDERVAAAEAVARPPGDAEVVVVRLARQARAPRPREAAGAEWSGNARAAGADGVEAGPEAAGAEGVELHLVGVKKVGLNCPC